MSNLLTNECIEFVTKNFYEKYKDNTQLDSYIELYNNMPNFSISDNVFNQEGTESFTDEVHYVMRLVSQYYMEKVFESMKIDMNDGNVAGFKGTPYRVIKTWTGADIEDDTELMSGRWTKRPVITCFDNNDKNSMIPITKRIDIVSVCSHHIAPFSTMFRPDSYAIVSYIPKDKILGISKLQRLVDWCSRRGQLQEGLTKLIYDEVSAACASGSVYVKLYNLAHTCEKLRGTQANDGAFTSEYYGGLFRDKSMRDQVQQN
jgi:GTP cyclohydrolase I